MSGFVDVGFASKSFMQSNLGQNTIKQIAKGDLATTPGSSIGELAFVPDSTNGTLGVWNARPEVSTVQYGVIETGINYDSVYWTFSTPDNDYYVWFNVNNEANDPAPGATGVEVAIGNDATIADITNATQAAIDALDDVTATDNDVDTVTITNVSNGNVTDIANGGTAVPSLTVGITTQGLTTWVNVRDGSLTFA